MSDWLPADRRTRWWAWSGALAAGLTTVFWSVQLARGVSPRADADVGTNIVSFGMFVLILGATAMGRRFSPELTWVFPAFAKSLLPRPAGRHDFGLAGIATFVLAAVLVAVLTILQRRMQILAWEAGKTIREIEAALRRWLRWGPALVGTALVAAVAVTWFREPLPRGILTFSVWNVGPFAILAASVYVINVACYRNALARAAASARVDDLAEY